MPAADVHYHQLNNVISVPNALPHMELQYAIVCASTQQLSVPKAHCSAAA